MCLPSSMHRKKERGFTQMNELWYNVLSKTFALRNCSCISSSRESTSNSAQIKLTVLHNATQIRGQMWRDINMWENVASDITTRMMPG
ncbi:rCG25871 [Rattus norvegicus]|uniref:RCG25871 n=1 Tax=Rattus norvegicus TaxID=10116 RepID=A6I3W7_RAT|nr:rCG25871 [Rattus norvegicus]